MARDCGPENSLLSAMVIDDGEDAINATEMQQYGKRQQVQ